MNKNRKERKVYESHIVTQEGEVVQSQTVYKTQSEPEYVKLYIDCILTVKGLRKGLNPIFLAFLPYMSYADINGQGGGQVIFVNKALKELVAKKLNLGIDSINKALSEFTRAGLFKRLTVGTYQVNPNIVGKGEWVDIKNIRATFDFRNKDIIADIVHYEEGELTAKEQALEDEAQLTLDEVMNNDVSGKKDSSKAG